MKYLVFSQHHNGNVLLRTEFQADLTIFEVPECVTVENYESFRLLAQLFDSIQFDPRDWNQTDCMCCPARWGVPEVYTTLKDVEAFIEKEGVPTIMWIIDWDIDTECPFIDRLFKNAVDIEWTSAYYNWTEETEWLEEHEYDEKIKQLRAQRAFETDDIRSVDDLLPTPPLYVTFATNEF